MTVSHVSHTHETVLFELKMEGDRLRKEVSYPQQLKLQSYQRILLQGKLLESLDKFEARLKLLTEQRSDKNTIRNAK